MPVKTRTSIAFCLLVVMCTLVCGWWVRNARPMLDEAPVLRRACVSPWDNSTYEKHLYSIDWPAFARWLWRGVFHFVGWHWPEFDDDHYMFRPEAPAYPANFRLLEGELAPRAPVYVLRTVAAVFLTATCLAIFFLALEVTGSAIAAFVAPLPILFHPAAGQWIIAYPGTDAMILFWLVAFFALWVHFHVRGSAARPKQVLVMAVVAGLGAGTKINGGLLTAAFALYLVIRAKGSGRLWLTAAFCAVAFAVFVAINPVLWQPGGAGVIQGVREMLARRVEVMRRQEMLHPLPRIVFFERRLLLLPLAPWLWLVFHLIREQQWLVPTKYWALVVFFGSYFTLNRYDARLGFPVDAAWIVPGTIAVLVFACDTLRRRRAKNKDRTPALAKGNADGKHA